MKNLRKGIQLKTGGGLLDLFDNYIKTAYNITDEEYNYILENIVDEDIPIFVNGLNLFLNNKKSTFIMIKKGLIIRNKYLAKMKI